MENKPPNSRLPPTATDSDEARIAIGQVETEAQTHDCCPDDKEKENPLVPSGSATREQTGVSRLLLPGENVGTDSPLLYRSGPLNEAAMKSRRVDQVDKGELHESDSRFVD